MFNFKQYAERKAKLEERDARLKSHKETFMAEQDAIKKEYAEAEADLERMRAEALRIGEAHLEETGNKTLKTEQGTIVLADMPLYLIEDGEALREWAIKTGRQRILTVSKSDATALYKGLEVAGDELPVGMKRVNNRGVKIVLPK